MINVTIEADEDRLIEAIEWLSERHIHIGKNVTIQKAEPVTILAMLGLEAKRFKFAFHPKQKPEALLFKLTFGGNPLAAQ